MSIGSRYRHIVKLGEGTYGTVYRAAERETGRVIAFKRMMSSSDEEGVPGTAIREISLLKELRHDNIVSMYEVLFEQPKITLIFELCDYDLKKFLEDQPNGHMDPETEVGQALKQMFLGLQYLHSRGVVHRDLKPQNVFLNLYPHNRDFYSQFEDSAGATAAATPSGKAHRGVTAVKETRRGGEGRGGSLPQGEQSNGNTGNTTFSVHGSHGSAEEHAMVRLEEGAQGSNSTIIQSTVVAERRSKGTIRAESSTADSPATARGTGYYLRIKLGDFGLARVDNIPVKKYSHEVVTLWYRSPDAVMGSALYSFPVDIWSMGAIFFEIVTGKVLFCGRSEEEQLFRMFFLLGSPTYESWPSMYTYPKMRERLQSVMTLCTQLRHTLSLEESSVSRDTRRASRNSSNSQDPFFDFFKRHLPASIIQGSQFRESVPGTDQGHSSSLFSHHKENSYHLPSDLWFPNPMLDAFLDETGFTNAVGEKGVDLLRSTLEYEPSRRITCEKALQHRFLANVHLPSTTAVMEQLVTDLKNTLQAAGL